MEPQIENENGLINYKNIVVVEPQPLICEGFKFVLSEKDQHKIERCDSISNINYLDTNKFYCINIQTLTRSKIAQILNDFTENNIRHLFYSLSDAPEVRDLACYAIQKGAMGMLINVHPDVVRGAILQISNYEKYFCKVSQNLKTSVLNKSSDDSGPLTQREVEVLKCLANGKSNKDVANELDISVRTVETHRSRIMGKLKARSFADLVRYALKNHVV